jgi:hypothetical protein
MTAALSLNVFSTEKKSTASDISGSLCFRQENPVISTDWDSQIAGCSGNSIFHSAAWAKVLTGTYGFTPVYLAAGTNQKSFSAMPLMEVKSWLTGKRGASLPYTDECVPLGESDDIAAVAEQALHIGRSRNWKNVEFRSEKKIFGEVAPSTTFFGHKLQLTDADSLFNRFESSVRRAVRKAEKSEVKVEFSESFEAVRDFYRLHCLTRKKHGLPPQPFRFFQQIHEHIIGQKKGIVVTAKSFGHPIASAMFFFNGLEAVYKFGASNKSEQQLRANNLVMWEAIKWFAANGVKMLRFGRTSCHNEGLRRYKLSWGAEEYRIFYYQYDLRRNVVVPENDRSSGWHNHFFRNAPIVLNRLAGAFLYKHIA